MASASAALAGSMKDDAEPAPAREFSWSFNIGATSDYVFRGYTQTLGDPAVQGGLDASYGIFYAGVWASNVDFGGDLAEAEVDFYAGIKPVVGPVTFDLGVLYYAYPGANDAAAELDYVELKLGASSSYQSFSFGATAFYSPEYTLEVGPSWAFEGALGYQLPALHSVTPTISGTLGHMTFDDDSSLDYSYWNAGMTLGIDKLALDFRYWGTDAAGCTSDTCDERFVASVKVVLP